MAKSYFYRIFAPIMKHYHLTYLLLLLIFAVSVSAQNRLPNRVGNLTGTNNRDQFGNQIDPSTLPDNLEDSTNTEIQSLPPKLFMWRLSETCQPTP